ncbi:MAG TPA: sulfite oxidase, partial [Isosphaeraceae bacterium]|nr:sulfite oxidase [Isosphaeraceae bacterium]
MSGQDVPSGSGHDCRFPVSHPTRRDWLRATAGAMVGGSLVCGQEAFALGFVEPGKSKDPRLIVRSRRPVDLETPVEVFEEWRTPNDLFFVRSHLGEPAVDLRPWKIEVSGLVKKELALEPADLRGFEQVSLPAVLQCAGNGRAFFAPTVPGVPWQKGAVGNATWSGVRLADVLDRAGVTLNDGHVHLLGADAPPHSKTPAYLRSITLDKARDPSTLVATSMNGEPLSYLHGGPARLVVPGWTGNHWMKWLRKIVVAREEAPGAYMQTSYRISRTPMPPGADIKPADLIPLTWMNVKSLFAAPTAGSRLVAGEHVLKGVAWTGEGHVTRVEVSLSPNSPWQATRLEGDDRPYTWR